MIAMYIYSCFNLLFVDVELNISHFILIKIKKKNIYIEIISKSII